MPVEFKESSIKDWVINNLEEGQIADVILQGCQSGIVSELIYYADSEAFYEKFKGEIWDRLSDMADDMGEPSILHLIVTFNGSKEVRLNCSSGTCWRGGHAKMCVVRSLQIKKQMKRRKLIRW